MSIPPWESEPNKLEFKDEETGLNCLIRRVIQLEDSPYKWGGHLCGYVEIPEDHPLYKKDLHEDDFPDFEVHMGIEWTGFLEHKGHKKYCIGFDAAHLEKDYIPYNFSNFIWDGEECTYKDMEFMKSECLKLAKQISDYGKGTKYHE